MRKSLLTIVAMLALTAGAHADPPDCKPHGPVAQMASKKQQALAIGVWSELARSADRHAATQAETARLDAEVGSVKECDEWAHAHGKPVATPGKGPRP